MSEWQTSGSKNIYKIKVKGELDERWADWFNGLAILSDGHSTTLIGAVTDQAKLRSILSKIWDLNLTVISVVQIESQKCEPHSQSGGVEWEIF
jgi:hypothetical protein